MRQLSLWEVISSIQGCLETPVGFAGGAARPPNTQPAPQLYMAGSKQGSNSPGYQFMAWSSSHQDRCKGEIHTWHSVQLPPNDTNISTREKDEKGSWGEACLPLAGRGNTTLNSAGELVQREKPRWRSSVQHSLKHVALSSADTRMHAHI